MNPVAAPPKLPLARTRPVPRRRTTAAGNGGRAQEPVREPRGGDPASFTRASQRILFLVSAHNSLSQCAYLALTELGHQVAVAVVDSAAAMESAVARHRPQLIVCPMLKTSSRVDLAHQPLPRRASGPEGRPRSDIEYVRWRSLSPMSSWPKSPTTSSLGSPLRAVQLQVRI
jgi:hypothetical protein